YLWITNISGWIAMFSTGVINIVNMLIIYSLRQDWVLGIMATILGTAWTPGMLLAPLLIKKFGKKRIMLFCKYVTIACSFLSIAGVYLDSFVIIIVSTYISTMLTSVVGIVTNSMTADIWDYQQYISGERLDGCMGIFAYLSAPITTAAALLIPYLYELQGFTSDWNILYDSDIRSKVFIITIVASAVTGFLSAIPYHFYDYTEERHEEIIAELQALAQQNDSEAEAENVAMQ
ncbi:MAG: MFS transporter, partial [Eubacterium sp.]